MEYLNIIFILRGHQDGWPVFIQSNIDKLPATVVNQTNSEEQTINFELVQGFPYLLKEYIKPLTTYTFKLEDVNNVNVWTTSSALLKFENFSIPSYLLLNKLTLSLSFVKDIPKS